MTGAGTESRLGHLVGKELKQGISPEATAVSEALRRRHNPLGILFYGSCFRGGSAEGVMDFFVLTDSYHAFYRHILPAIFNALLPPNVYYLEVPHGGKTIRAKYAVVSLRDLARYTSADCFEAYFWGRLSQPCGLVYARDRRVRVAVAQAVAGAAAQMVRETLPLMASRFTARELWSRALRESYRTEMRAEAPDRSLGLYTAAAERYDDVAETVISGGRLGQIFRVQGNAPYFIRKSSFAQRFVAATRWFSRRIVGRIFHVLRLAKAAHTFNGGLEYILWKIERHTGKRLRPKSWQRRHPILAAPLLIWKLKYWKRN